MFSSLAKSIVLRADLEAASRSWSREQVSAGWRSNLLEEVCMCRLIRARFPETDVMTSGFAAQGNEFSAHMLVASNWVLNECAYSEGSNR